MRASRRAAWVAAYAAATFFAFPHPLGDRLLDLGWVCAWIAPACLLRAIRAAPVCRAALLGFGAGVLAHAAVLHWIYVVTVTYGHAPPPLGVAATVLLASYIGAFSACFAAATAWLKGRGLALPLALAVLWTCLDHLRSFALSGFPWATLGYAQHANAALMGLAAWTGVYGLSFASVLGSAAALRLVTPAGSGCVSGGRGGALAGLVAVGALHALGALSAPPESNGPGVRAAVLQGNISQGEKWSPEWAERTLEIYESLTRRAVAEGARLVVWPETAVPGSPDADPLLEARLGALAAQTQAVLVVGAVGLEPAARAGTGPPRVYDSAFVFGPDGAPGERYDKSHLVPFGEYLPLRWLLGRFIRALARGSAQVDVSSGPAPRSVRLPLSVAGRPDAPEGAAVTAGVPICYELLFPDLVRRFVGDGAGALLAITNDAWYGRTGAPFQFLVMTAMRSAETGVWTARAANTGVSAFIDPRGRVRKRTAIFERGLLVQELPFRPPDESETFYVRHGDAFATTCWIGLLGLAAAASRRGRRPGSRGRTE